jgi:hypothetical protein
VIDLDCYRITVGAAAVTGLDSHPDLLQMAPFALERLVRQLFGRRPETMRTRSRSTSRPCSARPVGTAGRARANGKGASLPVS